MGEKTAGLRDALAASCDRAWKDWTRRNPRERFYAFGLYTTMDGEYFVPTISGDDAIAVAVTGHHRKPVILWQIGNMARR